MLATAAGLAAAIAAAAPAAAEEAAPVSWSVTPADASGPDGRVTVEHSLDAGAGLEDHFAVRNLGAETVTFRLAAADGFYNRNGRFDMLPSDQESVDAGTWIELPENVTVEPGATVVVPFTITVPEKAEPGDHAAGIAASVLSVTQGDGAGVGVESRVGFRVMTRVTGELAPAHSVTNVRTDYRTSWNPLRPGSIAVSFDVVNEGNTRLEVAGTVDVAGRSIAFPAEQEHGQEVLPGERHSFSLVVARVWPLFGFPGEIAVSPSVTTAGGESTDVTPSATAVFVWAVPWPQLLVLVGVALIVMALLWRRGRSKRRLEALLSQAREEGRRDLVREAQT
jgi:hypothetical protein